MGEGAGCGKDRSNRGKEAVAGRGGAHRPDQSKPDRDTFKRLPVPGRDPDRGVDQLVREDGRNLRRHCVGRVRQVRPDEYLEMAVAAASVIPTLADRLTLGSPAGEADRHAHAGGKGGVQRLDSGAMPTATRFNQLSRLSCSLQIALGVMAFRHRPCLVANNGG